MSAWIPKNNDNLQDIAAKVERGERLSFEDGLRLFEARDLLAVGRLAQQVRERRHGRYAFFNQNRHINPTNICAAHCNFCSFRRNGDEPDAYVWTPAQMVERVRPVATRNVTEFHIVGGLHPKLGLSYYEDTLRALKQAYPWIHLKALTAVEIEYLCQMEHVDHETALRRLAAAGLDSMPGGGAEIFHPRIRRKICPEKADADTWLAIHATAHRLGLRTNATMLYGHIESFADRIDHFIRLREQQDASGGFQVFIGLAFHPENNNLGRRVDREWTTGYDDLKTLAVARLMLDNFPHVKAYWIMLTPALSQVALNFGADDIDGTVIEERIYHDAGAKTSQSLTINELVRLIRATGFTPVERDTLYNVVKVWDQDEPEEPVTSEAPMTGEAPVLLKLFEN
jgi:aminodeoxyfutalosine synthase